MTDEEVTAFKKSVGVQLDIALLDNGGVKRVCEMHRLMPGMIDFIAGWVGARLAGKGGRAQLSQEEIRRLYDLVRLRIESESTSS